MRAARSKIKYRRVVLKLSGEFLGGGACGIDPAAVEFLTRQIADLHRIGAQVGLVIGGGNIIRGLEASAKGFERVTADCMGMLATVINGLALRRILEGKRIAAVLQSAIYMPQLVELYARERAIRHLEKGRVVVFVGGTGNPYFSTDTAAALRASEIGADALLKATKVDGVYSGNPVRDRGARLYRRLTYREYLERNLMVMDATAVALCMQNSLPIFVFNMRGKGSVEKIIRGERVGTLIDDGRDLPVAAKRRR